ncbi:hypothetical protein BH09BAC4_BH09BAC4_23480 [soil metagenome]
MTATKSLGTLLISVLLVSCTQQKNQKEVEKPSVPVIELIRQDAEIDHDYAGHIEADQNVEVRARVAGYLDKILVDEGHLVRKVSCCFSLTRPTIRLK